MPATRTWRAAVLDSRRTVWSDSTRKPHRVAGISLRRVCIVESFPLYYNGNDSTRVIDARRRRIMPTIRDVAQAAGVGIGTVSRVLSADPHVAVETRRRVQAA